MDLETVDEAPGRTDEFPYPAIGSDRPATSTSCGAAEISFVNKTFGIFVRRFGGNI